MNNKKISNFNWGKILPWKRTQKYKFIKRINNIISIDINYKKNHKYIIIRKNGLFNYLKYVSSKNLVNF